MPSPLNSILNQPNPAFHVMAKPIGPICNLDCSYCFYLEKEGMFSKNESFRMPDSILKRYILNYIESQDTAEISFAWQGGEPTLLGVDFFRRVVGYQAEFANGKSISNAFQTNGTLLNDEWCSFLHEHNFLVGLSVDGPPDLHDAYRVDKRGRPSSELVLRGLGFLQKHKVEFNTLTVVNRLNSKHPLRVYRYLKEIGSQYLQFIPLVERNADAPSEEAGFGLNMPPELERIERNKIVTDWSVEADAYGEFLVAIYDQWVRHDVGSTFVQFFDNALANWSGMGGAICVFTPTCGRSVAMEHNGDVYSCDHYVYPQFKIGNVMETSLSDILNSEKQRNFGRDKLDRLPKYCRECQVRFACHGGCPKQRFVKTPDKEPGLNYLCPSYKRIFTHMAPTMGFMTECLRRQQSPSLVMDWIRQHDAQRPNKRPRRNEECPCGSGRKFKQCCGKSA